MAAPTKIVGGFATDGRTYRVSWPQTRLAGVVEPSETASRLIADVQLDDGSPLEAGVVATGRVPTSVARPKVAKLRGGSQDVQAEKVSGSQKQVD